MEIIALSSGRVDDPLHIGRDKIGIPQIFMEIFGFRSRLKFCRSRVHANYC